ncbi:hypothetical protein Tco_1457895 [Tanacetum coccineum]
MELSKTSWSCSNVVAFSCVILSLLLEVISGVVANGVHGDGGSVCNVDEGFSVGNVVAGECGWENGFIGEVANGVIENAVSSAAVRAVNNGVAGASSSFLGDGANGVMGNGVGRAGARVINNGDAGAQSFSLGGAVTRSVPKVDMDSLLRNFNQEIRKDIARLREYRYIVHGLRVVVHRRRLRIDRLEAIGNSRKAAVIIRFWERMQLEDVEKVTRVLLMMKETEAKIGVVRAGKSNEVMNRSEEVGCSEGPAYCTVLEMTTGLYPVSNKALLTFLVVVSELVIGINGVSEETPSVRPLDAAVDAAGVVGVFGVIRSGVTVNVRFVNFMFQDVRCINIETIVDCVLAGFVTLTRYPSGFCCSSVLNGNMFLFFSSFMFEHLSLEIGNGGCKFFEARCRWPVYTLVLLDHLAMWLLKRQRKAGRD